MSIPTLGYGSSISSVVLLGFSSNPNITTETPHEGSKLNNRNKVSNLKDKRVVSTLVERQNGAKLSVW